MTTWLDVHRAWVYWGQFLDKNGLITLNAGNMTKRETGKLLKEITAKKKINNQANKLFYAICRQVCTDCGVKWNTPGASNLPDDMIISKKAEEKLHTFLRFVENH